ncbi:MAG: hypothetical protein FWC13_00645 [Oscillospiraceae bacterium]|nr:hypothetical protein [Oscillospiraceae bacterium]
MKVVNSLVADSAQKEPTEPTVFQRFYGKYKIFLAVVAFIVALTVTYCTLSFVISGSIGVPEQMQSIVTFNQKEVYSNLRGFELRGIDNNVIFTYGDFGYFVMENVDEKFSQYNYITIFLSRLSDPNTNILLKAHEPVSLFDDGHSVQHRILASQFRILDGQNTIAIPLNEWLALELRLGDRQHMSMIVEEVTLSRFPVLPDWFIPVYLILTLVIVALWYFLVFKGLGKWFLAHPWALLAVIIIFQALLMAYYVGQKRGVHIDDIYTISQATAFETGEYGRHFVFRPDLTNNWHTPDFFWNAITVQEHERFDFVGLHSYIMAVPHPNPLYQITYLFVASFFPDTFNFWIGGGINIFWMILISIFMYKSSLLIIKNPLLALMPVAIWAFSNAAMSIVVFIRFYSPSAFFFTLTTYLSLLLITKKTDGGVKFCLALGAVFLFGWITNTQFILFFGLLAALLLLWLLLNKEFKKIANCIITLVAGVGIHYFFYNVGIRGVFEGGRLHGPLGIAERQEGRIAGMTTAQHVVRNNEFLSHMDRFFFGENMILVLLLLVALLVIMVIKLSSLKLGVLSDIPMKDKLLQIFMVVISLTLLSAFAYISSAVIGENLTILAGILIMLLIIASTYMYKYKSVFISFFTQHNGYAIILLLVSVSVFFVIIARYNPGISEYRNRHMIPIYPTLAIALIYSLYLIIPNLSKRLVAATLVLVTCFIVLSNVSNRHVMFLYPYTPDTAAILSTEERRDSLFLIAGRTGPGVNYQIYDLVHFDRIFIADGLPENIEDESFYDALHDINHGEGIFISICETLNAGPIFEHMREVIGFSDIELLYRKYAFIEYFYMYRIVW